MSPVSNKSLSLFCLLRTSGRFKNITAESNFSTSPRCKRSAIVWTCSTNELLSLKVYAYRQKEVIYVHLRQSSGLFSTVY